MVCFLIWQSLLDYGKAAWAKCLAKISKAPSTRKKTLKQFDRLWGQSNLLCTRVGLKVSWSRLVPPTGIG
jgi:hypothetical protein